MPAYVQQWRAHSESQFRAEDLEKEKRRFVFGLDRIPPVPAAATEALRSARFSLSADFEGMVIERDACLVRPYLG